MRACACICAWQARGMLQGCRVAAAAWQHGSMARLAPHAPLPSPPSLSYTILALTLACCECEERPRARKLTASACALGLAAASRWQGCAKELIISRSPPLVHVYNLEEHGRRFFRSLVYSTDGARCLHHLPPVLQASASATSELGAYLVCAGDAATPSSVAARLSSLVIRRNLSGQLGTQTFVPSRLLYGCVSSFVKRRVCERRGEGAGVRCEVAAC